MQGREPRSIRADPEDRAGVRGATPGRHAVQDPAVEDQRALGLAAVGSGRRERVEECEVRAVAVDPEHRAEARGATARGRPVQHSVTDRQGTARAAAVAGGAGERVQDGEVRAVGPDPEDGAGVRGTSPQRRAVQHRAVQGQGTSGLAAGRGGRREGVQDLEVRAVEALSVDGPHAVQSTLQCRPVQPGTVRDRTTGRGIRTVDDGRREVVDDGVGIAGGAEARDHAQVRSDADGAAGRRAATGCRPGVETGSLVGCRRKGHLRPGGEPRGARSWTGDAGRAGFHGTRSRPDHGHAHHIGLDGRDGDHTEQGADNSAARHRESLRANGSRS